MSSWNPTTLGVDEINEGALACHYCNSADMLSDGTCATEERPVGALTASVTSYLAGSCRAITESHGQSLDFAKLLITKNVSWKA
jgi:hypothetical protein